MGPAIERIDFHNAQVGKPSNLQNSAVLRMLEEEENRRGGRTGNHDNYDPKPLRDVSWPPSEYDQENQVRSRFKDVIIPGVKRVAWPPPQEGILEPSEVDHTQQAPAQTQVAAPRLQQQSVKHVEPPPSTITLRPTAPVSQTPAVVYSAQPATASLRGGKHLRGDLKWPPENVKQRMEDDKRHLEDLSKGPACRPTRKEKDYTPFFAQHALNSTYPGYKIPPGTQYFRPE